MSIEFELNDHPFYSGAREMEDAMDLPLVESPPIIGLTHNWETIDRRITTRPSGRRHIFIESQLVPIEKKEPEIPHPNGNGSEENPRRKLFGIIDVSAMLGKLRTTVLQPQKE